MEYQLLDSSGWLVAKVQFNSRIHDDLIAVYLQDMCECVGAIGYTPVPPPLFDTDNPASIKAFVESLDGADPTVNEE